MDWKIKLESEVEETTSSPKKMKPFYFDFFREFREYIVDYVQESVNELCVSELPINGAVRLFDGATHGKVIIKNQGHVGCYLSTNGANGYRLDPGEKVEMYVNHQLFVVTVSGTTNIGMIRS